MNKITILLLGFLITNLTFSQEIEMKLNLLGYKFIQNGERLSWKELVKETESNYEANLIIKQAKSNHTISSITGFVGGFLIGIPIGQSLADAEPNWTLAYVGGGIAIVSIPFSLSAFNKVNKGIDKYNLSQQSAYSTKFNPEFTLVAGFHGIGLSMSF